MLDISVKVNGGIFEKNIPAVVRTVMYEEALLKINERLLRKGRFGSGGKGIGVQRNTITDERRRGSGDMELLIRSTRIAPRVSGAAWQKKNIGIVKAMAPRVLRKSADRIVEEMGSG